jgi:hypothetical protein
MSFPAFDALYSRSLDKGREAQEWGLWEMIYGYTGAASALIGAAIVSVLGFGNLFIIISLMSFIAAGLVWSLIKEEHFEKTPLKKVSKLKTRSRRR